MEQSRLIMATILRGAPVMPNASTSRRPTSVQEYLHSARLSEAQTHYRRAFGSEPHLSSQWLKHGTVLALSGRCESALEALAKTIRLDPSLYSRANG